MKALRSEVEIAHQKRSEIEVELVRKQADLKYLDETSQKELNTPVAELMVGEEALPSGEALAEVERQYDEIQARIEALGPINPQALEEFQECQQRHEFLSVQRQDLIDSIRDTERAIQEIDEVSRQKFAEAFEAINANFREAFQTLFGGGSGEMRLTDETNIAESGIDIIASPPGKKLQNVLLALGRRKSPGRAGPADGHLPLPAQPVLHPRRSRRPARRSQHRPPHAPAARNVRRHPVRHHHAFQEDHGSPPKPCTA